METKGFGVLNRENSHGGSIDEVAPIMVALSLSRVSLTAIPAVILVHL